MEVTVNGLQNLDKAIDSLDEFAQEFANETERRVKQKTPVATGKLQKGWHSEVTPTEITVSNEVPYAEYVENGTEHHAPVAMLRTTVQEAPQIAELVARKVAK